jgi:ribosomal protein S18 acetylase RimI-like enzyme
MMGETKEIKIRLMSRDDIDVVVDVYGQVLTPDYLSFTELAEGSAASPHLVSNQAGEIIREQLLTKLKDTKYALFVATESEVLGFIVGALHKTEARHLECWIEDLGVRPDMQHQGIGAQLVGKVVEWGRNHSAKYFLLESGAKNEAAHRFFTHLGFHLFSHVFWRDP